MIFLKRISYIAVLLLFTSMNNANAESDKKELRMLTGKELALFNTLADDDFSVFADGGDSVFKYDYVYTTAKELSAVYKKNQVRGDKKFKGKKIIISGVVESINSGIGDIPYLVLKTGDAFDSVQLTFLKKYRDNALELDKGDRIKYSCIGGSVIVGTPTLRDCKPIAEEKK